MQSAAIGYAFLFSGRGDYAAEREIVSWALETLRGLRKNDGASYLDRIIAILLILLSHAQFHSGNAEEAETSLRKAAALSRTFDAEPYYGVASLRYATGSETGSVHDGLGGTAGESIAYLLERLQDRELASMWKAAMDDIAESGSTPTGGNI